jgi:hypothetical protein
MKSRGCYNSDRGMKSTQRELTTLPDFPLIANESISLISCFRNNSTDPTLFSMSPKLLYAGIMYASPVCGTPATTCPYKSPVIASVTHEPESPSTIYILAHVSHPSHPESYLSIITAKSHSPYFLKSASRQQSHHSSAGRYATFRDTAISHNY